MPMSAVMMMVFNSEPQGVLGQGGKRVLIKGSPLSERLEHI